LAQVVDVDAGAEADADDGGAGLLGDADGGGAVLNALGGDAVAEEDDELASGRGGVRLFDGGVHSVVEGGVAEGFDVGDGCVQEGAVRGEVLEQVDAGGEGHEGDA